MARQAQIKPGTIQWMWRWTVLQTRKRLIQPMFLGRHSPEYIARGTGVGLLIAMTPTVGIQIAMVLGVWALTRRWAVRWDFNPAVACAWTFISNVATVPPIYYVFVLTGWLMMGHWENFKGFDAFSRSLEGTGGAGQEGMEAFWAQMVALMDTFGWPMLVGCLPWAVVSGWLGYVLTLRFLRRRQARRQAERALASPAPASVPGDAPPVQGS